jgi:arylsulfatase B
MNPLYRGFDKFYGYYSLYISYDSKRQVNGYVDIQNGLQLEKDATLLDSDYHSAYIFGEKANQMITDHYNTYGTSKPFFLYYSSQLVHFPYTAPDIYTERCVANGASKNYTQYCGLNLMLDEAIANLTCTLSSTGLIDNTYIVLTSDNGGDTFIVGDNYPYRGYKWEQYRGGISSNAFIFSPLLPSSSKGTSYAGQMHVTGKCHQIIRSVFDDVMLLFD